MRSDARVNEEAARLSGLSRDELVASWLKAYSHAPPSGIRNEMLVRSAAWHWQAKWLGGFSAETKRLLKHAMRVAEAEIKERQAAKVRAGAAHQKDGISDAAPINLGATHDGRSPDPGKELMASRAITIPIQPPRSLPGVGARLLRDWNGRMHVVDVVEGGFVFEGKTHRSLSAIAKLITGAHWSGPRFFGL